MLDFATINGIADRVARKHVAAEGLSRVLSEEVTDSSGSDALRITLVLRPEAVSELSGDNALDLLVELQTELRSKSEERLPIVEYATEQELEGEDADGPLEEHEGEDSE